MTLKPVTSLGGSIVMAYVHTHRCPICGAYFDCDDAFCTAGEGVECDDCADSQAANAAS